jgi:hypothetical protein
MNRFTRKKMSNEKEHKPTVLEANLAFDASPALFESIMDEGPIKYGPDDDGIDMITTPEGDEVVDPRSIMDVNVDAPVQSGATFNQDINPISQEEGDNYMSQFQDYIENIHKQEITDDDIDVAGATIQMLNNTRQDVAGYIRQQIADASARLSKQNVNPAQPDGVASDMTGDDRISSEGNSVVDTGVEVAPDLGDEGLNEIDSTTHLTPENDSDVGLDAIDMGLGDIDNVGSEPDAETEGDNGIEPTVEDDAEGDENMADNETTSESSGDDNYDPFSDLDLGEDDSESEQSEPSDETPSTGGEESESQEDESGDDETPAIVDDEPSTSEDKDDKPLTESVYMTRFRARLESVMQQYDQLCKRREAQAKCEAIVNAANKKMLAESVNKKNIKAQCESIVNAYRQATSKDKLKAKLESIVGKYRKQKMLAESMKTTAVKQKHLVDEKSRLEHMKSLCESIVNNFRKAESTATTAKAIIDSYKQCLV